MLRRLSMLRGRPDEEVDELAALVEPLVVDTGYVIVAEGDTDRTAYLVIEGRAAVLRGGRSVRALGAGEFIGEMANLNRRPRSASVVASTPMALVVVPPEHFRAFTGHPAIAPRLTESLSQRVRQATDRP